MPGTQRERGARQLGHARVRVALRAAGHARQHELRVAPALALAPLVLAELLADRAPARHASDLAVQNVRGAEVRVFSEVRVFATWHAGNRIVW